MSAHVEVSTVRMIARVTRSRRPIATIGIALSAALVQLVAWGGVRAAGPPEPGQLDRPVADLAVIGDAAGDGVPPLLLTLDTIDVAPGTVRATLLQRSSGWEPAATAIVTMLGPGDAPETPWLVQIEPGRYAILTASHHTGTTAIAPLEVGTHTTPALRIGAAVRLSIAVDDAGAIDVDGDGTTELVVSTAITDQAGSVCEGSVLQVLDGTTLAERAQWDIPDAWLAGGALGEWDGRPGGDLLAYAYGNCTAGPETAQRIGLYALRLADGAPIATVPPEDPNVSAPAPGIPLVADLDGDGHDEVVIRDGDALEILNPARGWARSVVARGNVMPLIAAAGSPREPGTLAWFALIGDDNLVVTAGSVTRASDGSFSLAAQDLDLASVAPARRGRALRSIQDTAIAQALPQAWRGDIDGNGCQRILAPLLTTTCAPEPDGDMRIGALWFATRPIVAFDEAGGNRELLIAATMEWNPGGEPRAATPAAAGVPGAWRHGPSPRFALSEVRAADAAYFTSFPVPRPTIERTAARGEATDFPGFTGVRILVRVTGSAADDPVAPGSPPLDDFLSMPATPGELLTVQRVPVPDGAESGRDGSFVHVSLADVRAPDGGPPGRWVVTITQINDWGEIAGPVRGTLVRDVTGPSLVLDTPFLTAPWPFAATVHGRSEPDVEVRGGTNGPVVADRRGRFELTTMLAPWPQTLELIASDESGNETVRQFSLIGGVDYRRLPWPPILAVALLVGAFLTTGRKVPRVREIEWRTDNEPLPEIEELPSARMPRT